jgi:hypothetical protein
MFRSAILLPRTDIRAPQNPPLDDKNAPNSLLFVF